MPHSRPLLVAMILPLALLLGAMGAVTDKAALSAAADAGAGLPDAGAADAGAGLPDAGTPDAGAQPPDAGVVEFGLMPPLPVPSRKDEPPIARLRTLSRKEDLLGQARLRRDGRLVVPGPQGEKALTIDPSLQEQLTRIMKDYQVPYGAAVVIEPSTGKVLALAEHSQAQPDLR